MSEVDFVERQMAHYKPRQYLTHEQRLERDKQKHKEWVKNHEAECIEYQVNYYHQVLKDKRRKK